MATPAVLDFRPRYRSDELDQLAKEVGEVLAPVFEANGLMWDSGIPSAVEIAVATHQLLLEAAQSEQDGMTGFGRIVVRRSEEDELRVFLDLGAVRAATPHA
jgi:hypothetical protein